MSEPENFLARWSRLKREGDAPVEQTPQAGEGAPPGRDEIAGDAAAPAEGAAPDANVAPSPPPFDPASLPSIESITATTDIRPFLASGVPASLTRAALRRAWTADPKIRDFIEMAENQWDFANPDSIPGFATFLPGEDVSKFIAQLGGKAEELLEEPSPIPPTGQIAAESAPGSGQSTELVSERPSEQVSASAPIDDVPSPPPDHDHQTVEPQSGKDNAATQNNMRGGDYAALPTRRSRGRALPQ